MAEAVINNHLRIGDTVLLLEDGTTHKVTKISPHKDKVQIDKNRWARMNQVQRVSGSTETAISDHKNKARLPSAQYIEIMQEIGYDFSMCAMDDRVYVSGTPITDSIAEVIKTEMRDRGHVCTNIIESAWTAHAFQNQFHPVKDYLDSLEWNGEENIAALCMKVEDKDNAFPVFFRRWAIGAVAKCFESAQNAMLVLDGAQDLGKSYFVRWLCSSLPKQYIEAPINPDSKDDRLQLITK